LENHFHVTVKKFRDAIEHEKGLPYEVLESKHSDLLDEGADELIRLIGTIGAPTAWNNANAYMGVGNGVDAFDPTDTGLQGASKLYIDMDATYPQLEADQKCRWRSTFASGEANFAWEEYTISNTNSDAGKNLMRILASKGTKVLGEIWELTIDEEFS